MKRPLWFRAADPERVREMQRDLPPVDPPLIQSFFGEVIVELRRDIRDAKDALDRGEVRLAHSILTSALEDHGQ